MKVGKLPDKTPKISYVEITKSQLGFNVEQCPCCKTGKMIIVQQFGANAVLVSMPNAPPKHINDTRKIQKMK